MRVCVSVSVYWGGDLCLVFGESEWQLVKAKHGFKRAKSEETDQRSFSVSGNKSVTLCKLVKVTFVMFY